METNPLLSLPPQLLEPAGSAPGIYALILYLNQTRQQQIGRLGTFTFFPGSYLYIGSARGPGGIAARVGRHIQNARAKRRHWHIDWLRAITEPIGVIWTHASDALECNWAQSFSTLSRREPGGFGASDCGCPGHLIRLDPIFKLDSVRPALSNPDGPELHMAHL